MDSSVVAVDRPADPADPAIEPMGPTPKFPLWYDHPEYDGVVEALNATVELQWAMVHRARVIREAKDAEITQVNLADSDARAAREQTLLAINRLDPEYVRITTHIIVSALRPLMYRQRTNQPPEPGTPRRRATDRLEKPSP